MDYNDYVFTHCVKNLMVKYLDRGIRFVDIRAMLHVFFDSDRAKFYLEDEWLTDVYRGVVNDREASRLIWMRHLAEK